MESPYIIYTCIYKTIADTCLKMQNSLRLADWAWWWPPSAPPTPTDYTDLHCVKGVVHQLNFF